MRQPWALFIIIVSMMLTMYQDGLCEEKPTERKSVSQLGILDNLGSPLFNEKDFSELIFIVTSLREKNNPVACLLFEKLSTDMKRQVEKFNYSTRKSGSFEKALTDEINRILSGPCIYDRDRFAGVELFWHTRELLDKNLSGGDLARLNRMLLEDAFPDLEDASPEQKRTPRFKGDPKARELLEKNGFVVVPNFERQIFSFYTGSDIPVFITTDSIFSTFHRNLEESMKQVEKAQHGRLSIFLRRMISVLADRSKSSKGPERQPVLRTLAFFMVAARLNGDTPDTSGLMDIGTVKEKVDGELQRIKDGKGVMESLVFDLKGDYRIDYSTFNPRGFYAGDEGLSRYFAAITWLGNFSFRVTSDEETQSALMIVKALMDDKELLRLYRDIEGTNEFCWGRSDDLTVGEYLDAAHRVWGDSIDLISPAFGDRFRDFRSLLQKMRDPHINSVPSPAPQAGTVGTTAKGLCLFGKRILPDSWVFECLCHPGVPGKKFAEGLDLMNALGSRRASAILSRTSEDFKSPGYAEALKKAEKGLGEEMEATESKSIYTRYLRMIQNFLFDREIKETPACTATDAWKDRKLNTALASWAMMRHTWGLQAKKKVTLIGSCYVEPGYVEPEIRFYSDLRMLNKTCREKFLALGLDTGHYDEIGTVLTSLISISEKELKRESLTDDDRDFIRHYGTQSAHLCFYENESCMCDMDEMALITDVASELSTGQVLYEGIGGAMEIYVIVPFKGGPALTKGGVLSYYEFARPDDMKLTDGEWKGMVRRRETPDLPGWVSSFVAFHDDNWTFEELRKGKVPEEAFSSRDERIVPFLMNSVCDDRVFSDVAEDGQRTTNREKAVYLLMDQGGRHAVPVLMKLLGDPDRKIRLNAAFKLVKLKDPSLIPELLSIHESGKRPASWLALDVIGKTRCTRSKEILATILKEEEKSCSPLIEPGEIDHPDHLVSNLIKPQGPIFPFIYSRLSATTRDLLLQCENFDDPSQALVKAIIGDLNQIIIGPSIYQKERFEGIKLRGKTLKLLDKASNEGECAWLNRMLLQDAYYYTIHNSHDCRRIAFNNLIYIYRACEYNDEYLAFVNDETDNDRRLAIKAISYLWSGDRYISDYLEKSRKDSMVHQEGRYWVVEDGTVDGLLRRWRYPTQWSKEEISARDKTVSLLMDIARTEKDFSINREAIDALGCIGDDKVVPLLITLKADYALSQIGGAKVEDYFIERLRNESASHSKDLEWTLECLGRMRCRKAVPLIFELLDDRTILQKQSGNDGRLICDAALKALFEIAPQGPHCDLNECPPREIMDVVLTRWKEWWNRNGKKQEWK